MRYVLTVPVLGAEHRRFKCRRERKPLTSERRALPLLPLSYGLKLKVTLYPVERRIL